MNPRQNHGQRILPTWQRLSARKRLQLSYRELLGALGDLSEQHTQFLERHNALAVAYKHLQLEVRALRRLVDAAAFNAALAAEVQRLEAAMAVAAAQAAAHAQAPAADAANGCAR